MRREQFVFALLLLLGIGLRLWRLGNQPLWFDESWGWAAARMSIQDILALQRLEALPPLYYLLLKLWLMVISETESGIRLFSVLCSVLTLGGTALLAQHWVNRRAAIAVLALAMVSSFDLYYAQEARMYTLMAGLGVLSYFLLCESIEGHPRLFVLWGFANLLLALTHAYSLLMVVTEILFLIGLSVWRYRSSRLWDFISPWLGVGLALSGIGLIYIVPMVWQRADGNGAAAWIAQPFDLVTLFNLIAIGIGSARSHFLDGTHLILPALANIADWVWLGVGIALIGLPLIYGIKFGACSRGLLRQRSLLGLVLIVVPAGMGFTYSILFHHSVWALKPFLGMAFIIYLWAGIGLSRISRSWVRSAMLIAVAGVALGSLIPYFTQWQKSDARLVWRSLPQSSTPGIVLVHPSYLWVLAQYYLGDSAIIAGVERDESGTIHLVRRQSLVDKGTVIDCSRLESFKVVWVYSTADDPRARIPEWSECILSRKTWLFEKEQWVLLHE